MAAVSGLRSEFEGKVDLTVISAEETKNRQDEIVRYNLAARSHGLVAFDNTGEAVMSIAGHQFGEPEIRMAIAQVAGD